MLGIYIKVQNNELQHSGVKGMHWGIRRYQNADGSLTPEGLARYKKLLGMQNKSKYRINQEQKYQQKGYSKQQAIMAADRKIRTEKALAVVGAVALTAAVATTGYRHRQKYLDSVLKSGSKLMRTSTNELAQNMDHAFYAATNNLDASKYEGMYSAQLKFEGLFTGKGSPKTYKHTMDVANDIKIPSNKKAQDIFIDLYKNGKLDSPESYDTLFDPVKKRTYKGNVNSKRGQKILYDNFNRSIMNDQGAGNSKIFFDELKKNGYGAVRDVNDVKYSGYKTKNPLIVFDAKNNVTNDRVRSIKTPEWMAKNAAHTAKIYATSPVGALGGLSVYYSSVQDSNVRSLHASGKTNQQIANSLNIPVEDVQRILNKKNNK